MKKKRFLLSYIFIILAFSVFSQERAPLNPEFIDYYKNYDKTSEKKNISEYSTGYIPWPVYIHFQEQLLTESEKKSINELPSRFDLRDDNCVTSIKDQNPLGSCWTFSSVAAIESSWIKKGYENLSIDLSEENMGVCHGFENGIDDGGNDLMTTAYLTRLIGPVSEASDPYSGSRYASCPGDEPEVVAYVPIVEWLPADINVIKKSLYTVGAVSASIHWASNPSAYYNFGDFTYLYNGSTAINHAVLIVGWDDDKVIRGGFQSPDVDPGAWIVKNSWGENWGDDGYFYVSYHDSKFLSTAALFNTRLELDQVDTLYMEDKLGFTSSYGFGDDIAYGLAKYEAPGQQFINKVGTYINTSGSFIDIEIYDDFSEESGLENLLASSYNNVAKFPGYLTFDIKALVQDDFYVKIKYFSPGYSYPIPAEAEIINNGEPYAVPEINPSGRFWISSDAEEWKAIGSDIEDSEADLCIRAYAETDASINAYFTSDKQVVCLNSAVQFSEDSNGDVSDYLWDFGEGANPATASTSGPHNVSYSVAGVKDISLTVTGPGGSKTMTRSGYLSVVDELDVFLPYSEVTLGNGRSINLIAFGADEYTWEPSTGLDVTTGNSVNASPTEDIVYTVSGTQGACTGSTTVSITVVEIPPNDDACDAIEVTSFGFIGTFDNYYGSKEPKEPFAPEAEDGCEKDLHWCVEGGVQNSVWFTFLAPEGGLIGIDAKGMDNQLALYKADHCDSLFTSTGYELVAAYDDYYPESENYAAAIESVIVIPGERYFLQVDGSAGGEEGEFHLFIHTHPIGIEGREINADNRLLNVYPNPGNGAFKITIADNISGKITASLLNLNGEFVYNGIHEFNNESGFELDLKHIEKGMYFLIISDEDKQYHKKIVIQ